jgi:glutamine synthetase
MKDALDIANRLYVDVNIFADENKRVQEKLPQLPTSCWDSAQSLIEQRDFYEEGGVFPAAVIDGLAKRLSNYNDRDLSERLYGKNSEIRKLVEEHLHC